MRVRIQDNGGARLMRRWPKAKTERGMQKTPWEIQVIILSVAVKKKHTSSTYVQISKECLGDASVQ